MIIICPRCRSKLRAIGQFQLNAPQPQSLICPVCGQEIWLSRGLMPILWTSFEVIERHELAEGEKPIPITQPLPKMKVFEGNIFMPSLENWKVYGAMIAIGIIVLIVITRK